MVRNMAGLLADAGRGLLDPKQLQTILEARDRTKLGPTAPAEGLCLLHVYFEEITETTVNQAEEEPVFPWNPGKNKEVLKEIIIKICFFIKIKATIYWFLYPIPIRNGVCVILWLGFFKDTDVTGEGDKYESMAVVSQCGISGNFAACFRVRKPTGQKRTGAFGENTDNRRRIQSGRTGIFRNSSRVL